MSCTIYITLDVKCQFILKQSVTNHSNIAVNVRYVAQCCKTT